MQSLYQLLGFIELCGHGPGKPGTGPGKPGTGTQAGTASAILGRRKRKKLVTSGHWDGGRLHTCILFLFFLLLPLLLEFCRSQKKHRHRGVIRFDADCEIASKLSSSLFQEASLYTLYSPPNLKCHCSWSKGHKMHFLIYQIRSFFSCIWLQKRTERVKGSWVYTRNDFTITKKVLWHNGGRGVELSRW